MPFRPCRNDEQVVDETLGTPAEFALNRQQVIQERLAPGQQCIIQPLLS